jgi:hypothetical protein
VQWELTATVVDGLQVTARREQYEQLLETARWVMAQDYDHDHADAFPYPTPEVGAPYGSFTIFNFVIMLTN